MVGLTPHWSLPVGTLMSLVCPLVRVETRVEFLPNQGQQDAWSQALVGTGCRYKAIRYSPKVNQVARYMTCLVLRLLQCLLHSAMSVVVHPVALASGRRAAILIIFIILHPLPHCTAPSIFSSSCSPSHNSPLPFPLPVLVVLVVLHHTTDKPNPPILSRRQAKATNVRICFVRWPLDSGLSREPSCISSFPSPSRLSFPTPRPLPFSRPLSSFHLLLPPPFSEARGLLDVKFSTAP